MSSKAVLMLPEKLDISGKAGDSFTHCFHQYTASFHPELVDIYLKQLGGKGLRVLDPFSGGGTTVTEAMRLGMNGYGVDLNPVAIFVGRAKTTKIPNVDELTDQFLDGFREEQRVSAFTALSLVSEEEKRESEKRQSYVRAEAFRLRGIEQYFEPSRFKALVVIRHLIREFSNHSYCPPEYKNFLLCCLSGILRDCSKLDPSTHEYYILKDKLGLDPWFKFPDKLQQMVRGMRELNACEGTALIQQGSAFNLPIADKFIHLAITSPPYGEAVPYNRVFRLTTGFLDMDIKRFQREEIGFREYPNPVRILDQLTSDTAKKTLGWLIDKAKAGDKRSKILERKMSMYFLDTGSVWKELGRVVMSGGFVSWIVGNNTFWEAEAGPRYGFSHPTGEKIDNVQIAQDYAVLNGFTVRKVSRIKGYALTKIADESAVLVEKN